MINTLFTGWHLMRWIRLIFGIAIGVQAIISHEMMMGLLSGIFVFQSLTNSGCCSVNTPITNTKKVNNQEELENITYEEIK